MTRDLKRGDFVRVLGGAAEVRSVIESGIEPVFNLRISQAESFLVGLEGALVHDNSVVQPVRRPFDGVR